MTTFPIWLQDEELLRDEAVVLGLSGGSADPKLELIRQYFVPLVAEVQLHVEHLEETFGDLNQQIAQAEDQTQNLEGKIEQLANTTMEQEPPLLRIGVGFVLSVVMSTANYFLVAEVVSPRFEQGVWVSVGVFLAGMFNLFTPISYLHQENQQSPTFKRLLEEFGLPVVASVFVGIQATQVYMPLQALALWAFVFFLFLFAGKLLLGNLTLLQRGRALQKSNRQLIEYKTTQTAIWKEELRILKTTIAQARLAKNDLLPQLTTLQINKARVNAQREATLRLFESEYQLAKQLKQLVHNPIIK